MNFEKVIFLSHDLESARQIDRKKAAAVREKRVVGNVKYRNVASYIKGLGYRFKEGLTA